MANYIVCLIIQRLVLPILLTTCKYMYLNHYVCNKMTMLPVNKSQNINVETSICLEIIIFLIKSKQSTTSLIVRF